MNMKKLVLVVLLTTTSFIFSQNKIKYRFSIDTDKQEAVIQIIENDLGRPKEVKKNKLLWLDKTNNYEYKISLKKRKILFFYKGNDVVIENKIKALQLKIKNNHLE
jgi:hypothetical protein